MRVYRYPSTFAQKGVSRGRNLATEGVLAFSARATNSRPQDSSLCYPACFAQNAFSAPGHKYTLMLPHCVALGTPPRAQINKDSPTVLRCLYLIKRAWNKPNSSNSGACEHVRRTSAIKLYQWDVELSGSSLLTFRVNSSNDVFIALSSERSDRGDLYEILIGGWHNTQSVIRRSAEGPALTTVSTPDILSADELRGFWISWSPDGTIAVGREGEGSPFMQWQDPDPLPIQYFGYSTIHGSAGLFKFPCRVCMYPLGMESGAIPDDSITASSTWDDAGHEPYRGRLNGVTGVGAWAAGTNTIGEWLQVDLGEMKTVTGTIIQGRYNYDQWVTSYKLEYSVDGLSWITYASSDGSEEVFPGNTDRNTPVTNLLDSPTNARYVRFLPQSWHGWMGMRVEVLGCSVNACEHVRRTADTKVYQWDLELPGSSPLTFRAKSSNGVFIALSSERSNRGHLYEILIGGWHNTQSVIRRSDEGPALTTVSTPGILPADELRGFWISWAPDGTIAVGREGEGSPFMQWQDPDPLPIQYFGYATWYDSAAQFMFPCQACEHVRRTGGTKLYQWDVELPGSSPLTFRVKTSRDANIALSLERSDRGDLYEILIGGWYNTQSVIRRSAEGPALTTVSTPDILSADELRGFWISWAPDGTIAVGREGEGSPFMQWQDPDPLPFQYFGYSTAAKASNDVFIALSLEQSDRGDLYEILIGGWGNTQSVIRRSAEGTAKTTVSTPGILSADELRGFWISWVPDGTIAVGREGEGSPFMQWQDPDPLPIQYFGYSTGYGSAGQFRFPCERHPFWSASSESDSKHAAYRADINTRETADAAGAWEAETQNQDQWLMRDLGEVSAISGIVTKGRNYSPDWPWGMHEQYVTSFVISYGDENGDEKFYTDAEGEVIVRIIEFPSFSFPGNSDRDTEVVNDFRDYSGTVTARFIKIRPQTWFQLIAMRAKILTVLPPLEDLRVTTITSTTIKAVWTATTNPSAVSYRVWIRERESAYTIFTRFRPIRKRKVTFKDLIPGTEYIISATTTDTYLEGPEVNVTVATAYNPFCGIGDATVRALDSEPIGPGSTLTVARRCAPGKETLHDCPTCTVE
ncbi:hypothetical protein Bbelb_073340 [Branchiostoma belcheri]|nr:hypothetical protein Bbelb_073340 [Branchiostoma belcheri]